MKKLSERVIEQVSAWPGIAVRPHRFGGVEFALGEREIGHLHGEVMADIPFDVRTRKELVAAGLAAEHHLYPKSGWVSFYPHGAEAAEQLVALLRRNYERLTQGKAEQAADLH